MSFVSSLLQAIVRLDGEVVVLHVGEKPYIVTATEQVDLATKGLTLDAVSGILNQLLPAESVQALNESGAVQHRVAGIEDLPGEQFAIVAARGGDDIWLEIRRRRLARSSKRESAPSEPASSAPVTTAPEPPRPQPVPFRSPAAPQPAAPKPRPEPTRVTPPSEPLPPAASSDSPLAPVIPLTRSPIRAETPPPVPDQTMSSLERVLRQAAARGAAVLYLTSDAPPAIRIDGEIETLSGAPLLGPKDVEALLLTLMPERDAEALRTGAASEWICEIPDLGRVRCMTFRDSRGPGGVFRLMRSRGVSAEQLGLTPDMQALALESEGLLLVAGPRLGGKRTLISAFVDVINRNRRDHVITIESEINITHQRVNALVSQREVRGGMDELLAAARAALREDPDILVVEEVRTPELMNLALDAAARGHLVIGGFSAPSATSAIDRIIDLYPAELRRSVQLSLAQSLRGVIAQVLLKKKTGGRVPAREVLLNTPAVRSVLAEGKTSQLPLAIEGGRLHGMMPLNDALIAYVQKGIVDVRDAYRNAADRAGFMTLLKRQGIDTSSLERYA